jgi:N-6 DNA Methylase
MPLSRKEIRNLAYAFANEWQGETRENAEAKPFWEAFFQVSGISRRWVASFEQPVKKLDAKTGFIDLFWKGKLLVEHKSHGKDLDKAYKQGMEYFVGLKEEELPRYVLVSDFERFRLYDLDTDTQNNFTLDQLPDHVHLFDFIAGYEDIGTTIQEVDLNIKAAELLGKFHDVLLASGYAGHALEIFLVRILFCLFAEDTDIFTRHQLINYILNYTRQDGSDTDMHLTKLFQVLDTSETGRNKNLSEDLNAFPYVNGHLFAERIDMPSFDAALREELIECAYFDWSTISPAILGSLFQSVMNKQARRNLGAHYTSERDILRLIKPLFLDELHEEFNRIRQLKKGKQQQLINFQQRLSSLQFLDPACGCGNFLIITYRELRRLELAILEEQNKDHTHSLISIEPLIRLDCFHGIEIEEWPVRIAEVAMWLTQHQMNREFAKKFGHEPDLLPLKTAAHIVHGNALRLDWHVVVPVEKLNFIMGNPPFVGKKEQSRQQKDDMSIVFSDASSSGTLDFVCAWYKKAADFIGNKSEYSTG